MGPGPAAAGASPEVEPDIRLVTVDVARLRSGPGTDHATTGSLNRGSEVEVLAVEGEWLKIRQGENGEAWLHASLAADR